MSREKTWSLSTESPKLSCSNFSSTTMSRPHRRLARQPQQPQQYSAVSQASPGRHESHSSSQQHPYQQAQPQHQYQPQQHIPHAGGPRSPPPPRSFSAQKNTNRASGRAGLTMGVVTGAVGAGYGPYSVSYCILQHETSKISSSMASPRRVKQECLQAHDSAAHRPMCR